MSDKQSIAYPIAILAALHPYELRGHSWHTGTYGQRLRIGSASEQDIPLRNEKFASRFHAEVWLDLDVDANGEVQFFISDKGSTNGTFLYSSHQVDEQGKMPRQKVGENQRLYENDQLHIGETVFIIKFVPVYP